MTLKPLSNRVVIKFVEAEEKTQSGIFLTASAQEKPQIAEVVAVGPGGLVDGKEVVMTVKVGDKVMLNMMHFAVMQYDANSIKKDMGMQKIKGYQFPKIELTKEEQEKFEASAAAVRKVNQILYDTKAI